MTTIPIGVCIIAMFAAAALGWLFGWITKRPEKPKRWPNGSALQPQKHEGPYVANWTPETVDQIARREGLA